MADITINGLVETTTPAAADFIGIWDVAAAQYKKVKRSNLVGATVTGGGTIATGGFTLTLPASGTAALVGINNNFVAQTINGIDIGQAVTNMGISSSGTGILRVRAIPQMTITGPGSQFVTGFSWGIMIPVIEIPGTALSTGIISTDGVNVTVVNGTHYTNTINTASKINFYISSGTIVCQNMFSGVTVNAHFICLGA